MQKLAFGTDGIRGRVGDFPFTPTDLQHFGSALGRWMVDRYGKNHERIKVLLAGDTRESVDSIKKIISEQLVLFPIDVIDAGVIPTPAVLMLIRNDKNFACGVMISASHNPYYDNGIKLFDAVAGKLTPIDEARIIELFDAYAQQNIFCDASQQGTVVLWPQAEEMYVDAIIAAVPAMLARGCKVVLDCANGATYKVAAEIFKALGAEVVVLHDAPTGTNINDHAGALHPERLQEVVVQEAATIGFAFDGDGDRIVMVNAIGHAKDGDDVLAVLLDLDEYVHQNVVVGTVMSNSGFEAYLQTKAKTLVRTAVGDKHIAAKLDELELTLGGEPSGHIILKNYLPSGDGILVAVKVLQALQISNKWSLDHVTKYPQLTVNVPVFAKHDLKGEPYAGILRAYDEKLDSGRILVRYSGTEPLLRIMVEGVDALMTENIARQLAHDLQQALNS